MCSRGWCPELKVPPKRYCIWSSRGVSTAGTTTCVAQASRALPAVGATQVAIVQPARFTSAAQIPPETDFTSLYRTPGARGGRRRFSWGATDRADHGGCSRRSCRTPRGAPGLEARRFRGERRKSRSALQSPRRVQGASRWRGGGAARLSIPSGARLRRPTITEDFDTMELPSAAAAMSSACAVANCAGGALKAWINADSAGGWTRRPDSAFSDVKPDVRLGKSWSADDG